MAGAPPPYVYQEQAPHVSFAPKQQQQQQNPVYYQQSPPAHQPPPGYPPAQPGPRYAAAPNYGSYQPVPAAAQHHHTNERAVVVQPQAPPTVTLIQRKPDNYIVLSVLTLLCCCWLFGLVALMYGMQVDSAYTRGNVAAAQTASRAAKTWNIVGIAVGCVSIGVAIFATLIPTVVIGSDSSSDYSNY